MISKSIVLLCCFLATVLAVEKYTDKYDDVNIQEIIENKKLLDGYGNCLIDKGRCTTEGKELKGHLKDALQSGCEKCTEIQKEKASILIDHVIRNERELWKKLTDKYDPEGVWRKKYEDRAREKGIEIPKD